MRFKINTPKVATLSVIGEMMLGFVQEAAATSLKEKEIRDVEMAAQHAKEYAKAMEDAECVDLEIAHYAQETKIRKLTQQIATAELRIDEYKATITLAALTGDEELLLETQERLAKHEALVARGKAMLMKKPSAKPTTLPKPVSTITDGV